MGPWIIFFFYARSIFSLSISDIKMDIAVPHSTGNDRALEVEECACPQGYRGPSCQVWTNHISTKRDLNTDKWESSDWIRCVDACIDIGDASDRMGE